jgi:acyl dehydratase
MVVTAGPTVSTDSGSAQFVSGDNTTSTPVAVDPGILLTDGSSTTLVSATVAITGNFQGNHDQLLFTANPATMGNISGAYDSSTGVLTLTAAGGASLLQWQNALASIQFTNDLVVPSSSTRTVSFQINDGTLTSSTATRNVTVTATDQTPVIGAGGNTVSFVAGDNTASTAVAVNDAITVGDLDGGPLQQAVVTITGHYEATDVLAFNNNSTALYGNISAVYANGTLTLTSSGSQATLAQWQNALQGRHLRLDGHYAGRTRAHRQLRDQRRHQDQHRGHLHRDRRRYRPDTGDRRLVGSLTFTQGDNVPSTPVVIDSGITVSDRDNATLTQANVVIASGYDANGDTLLFTNDGSTMGNITGAYSNGVLALSSAGGTATLAQWQAARARSALPIRPPRRTARSASSAS